MEANSRHGRPEPTDTSVGHPLMPTQAAHAASVISTHAITCYITAKGGPDINGLGNSSALPSVVEDCAQRLTDA
jgi:hypothetical protein